MLAAKGLHGHIQNNYLKSAALLAGFVVLIALFWYGWCLIYTAIADGLLAPAQDKAARLQTLDAFMTKALHRALERWWLPVLVSIAWFGVAYAIHTELIRWATGAQPVERKEQPRLYNLVENLCISRGLPVPRIEIMPTMQLNAYAAGLETEDAVVAVTTGLLQALDDDELEAVLAHELTHIRNRDVQLMVVATVFAGGLTLLGDALHSIYRVCSGGSNSPSDSGGWSWGGSSRGGGSDGESGLPVLAAVAAIAVGIFCLALTHVFALLNRLAISRAREFMADAGAIEMTKNPDALIRALRKIEGNDEIPDLSAGVSAMMISSSFEGLFSTHPSIEDRVAALVQFAGGRDTPRSFIAPAAMHQEEAGSSTGEAASPWGKAAVAQIASKAAAFGRRRSLQS